MTTHPRYKCPYDGAELVLFFPNIPWFTGWYCTTCEFHMAATQEEVERELDRRGRQEEEEENEDGL